MPGRYKTATPPLANQSKFRRSCLYFGQIATKKFCYLLDGIAAPEPVSQIEQIQPGPGFAGVHVHVVALSFAERDLPGQVPRSRPNSARRAGGSFGDTIGGGVRALVLWARGEELSAGTTKRYLAARCVSVRGCHRCAYGAQLGLPGWIFRFQ